MMCSIQEHLKKKRAPIDKWSIKEQLCLASAVVRSGDQNWTSVSRALKVFQDPNRPADWFSQKNCAAQYGLLLDNVDTPKRKKRLTDKFSNSPEVVPETESTLELIKKKLTEERIQELNIKLQQNKKEYHKITYDMKLIKSGKISLEKLNEVYNAILERMKKEEKKNIEHAVWLREREEKKLEMERQLRPGLKLPTGLISPTGTKFKDDLPDSKDNNLTPEASKTTTSPLLTSLLKSPSPAPNLSLLNTSLASRVAALNKNGLVSSLSQDQENSNQSIVSQHASLPSSLEPNNSVTKQTPVFKTSIAHVDENSVLAEIVAKVKTAEASGSSNVSEDILNLDLVPFGNQNQAGKESKEIFDDLSIDEKLAVVDNIIRKEQEEELVSQLSQLVHSSNTPSNLGDMDSNSTPSEIGTEMSESDQIESRVEDIIKSISNDDQLIDPTEEDTKQSTSVEMEIDDIKPDYSDDTVIESKSSRENESAPGSVEVVEVELMEDEEEDGKRVSEDKKNLEMSQMVSDLRKECGLDRSTDEQDHDIEKEETNDLSECGISETLKIEEESEIDNQESDNSPSSEEEEKLIVMEDVEKTDEEKIEIKIDPEPKIVLEKLDSTDIQNVIEPKLELTDDCKEEECSSLSQLDNDDDDSPIEVIKEDKHGKMKRDYSRRRLDDKPKLDDDDFEILSKKSDILKYKDSDRRSESPWAEEDETIQFRTRRQYSISIDSPNSPASSITEDEKEYRMWKKSIFLVFNRLCTHRNSSLFAKPITNDQAPGYHNLVKRPMDLSTIKKNLDNGTLRTTGEFQRDVMLMFQNAIMYNKIGSTVYNMAKEMQKEGLEQLQLLVQAQSQDYPVKRETRTSEPALKRKRGAEK